MKSTKKYTKWTKCSFFTRFFTFLDIYIFNPLCYIYLFLTFFFTQNDRKTPKMTHFFYAKNTLFWLKNYKKSCTFYTPIVFFYVFFVFLVFFGCFFVLFFHSKRPWSPSNDLLFFIAKTKKPIGTKMYKKCKKMHTKMLKILGFASKCKNVRIF